MRKIRKYDPVIAEKMRSIRIYVVHEGMMVELGNPPEPCRCDEDTGFDENQEVCVKHAPIHVYSHSVRLYKRNVGKIICLECMCWTYCAVVLDGCECICHWSDMFGSR